MTDYSFLKGGSGGEGADFLSLVTSDSTLGNGMFSLDIRKRFLTKKIIDQWYGLPSIKHVRVKGTSR